VAVRRKKLWFGIIFLGVAGTIGFPYLSVFEAEPPKPIKVSQCLPPGTLEISQCSWEPAGLSCMAESSEKGFDLSDMRGYLLDKHGTIVLKKEIGFELLFPSQVKPVTFLTYGKQDSSSEVVFCWDSVNPADPSVREDLRLVASS
jgi:hypothetical protein